MGCVWFATRDDDLINWRVIVVGGPEEINAYHKIGCTNIYTIMKIMHHSGLRQIEEMNNAAKKALPDASQTQISNYVQTGFSALIDRVVSELLMDEAPGVFPIAGIISYEHSRIFQQMFSEDMIQIGPSQTKITPFCVIR